MATSNGEQHRRQSVFDIRIFCVGTKPLLMNQYEQDRMVNDLVFKDNRIPDTTSPLDVRAAKTIFRNEEGEIVIPVPSIQACLEIAGCRVQLKGKTNLSKGGGKKSDLATFMQFLGGESVLLLRSDGTPVSKSDDAKDRSWKTDVRRGIIPSNGNTCAVIRAKFMDWAFLLNVRVDLSRLPGLTLDIVRKLFDTAGASQGLCGFIKAFGRFTVADGGWLVTAVDESTLVRPKAPAALMQPAAGAEVVATA